MATVGGNMLTLMDWAKRLDPGWGRSSDRRAFESDE